VVERREGDPFLAPQLAPHPPTPGGARMEKLLQWDPVDRCRLLILLTIPFFAAYGWRSDHLIAHPDVEPYYDRGTLAWMRLGIAAICPFWAAFLAWGSRVRLRPGPHTGYLVIGSLSWWVGIVSIAYALGPITTPTWIAVVIGCATHLLLMPQGVAILGIGTGISLLLASLACVAMGLVPYGPALAETPIVASQMAHLDRVVEDRTQELSRRKLAQAAPRESEARYRRLTDNAFDLIMEVDAKGTTLYAMRTSELTNQLLAYAGRGTLSTKPLDVGELLRELGDLLHTAISRKIDLVYDLPDALPLIEGREAVKLFREHAPDISAVLLDVTMPGLGGVEAFVEMRKIRPDARIILSSGYSEEEVAARFRGGEIDGFLQKPYEPEALIQKLAELMES
jgi:CheY-like chemotaxis protein/PAS domain-containing protein